MKGGEIMLKLEYKIEPKESKEWVKEKIKLIKTYWNLNNFYRLIDKFIEISQSCEDFEEWESKCINLQHNILSEKYIQKHWGNINTLNYETFRMFIKLLAHNIIDSKGRIKPEWLK